jgi:Xaa-Pro aminopeptidase
LQDEVMSVMPDFIRPGLHDFEIAAYAQYEAQKRGAEQGIFISSSSPSGKAAVFRPRHMQGRRIEAGDVFALLVETNGPGGYYTEIGRTFVLGKASAGLKKSLEDAKDAQAHTLGNLKPGVAAAEVFAKHNAYMARVGLPPERRLYSHGQGYDMVERPLIRDDETMTIETGMSIVVHPGYVNDEVFALICDNYRIESGGPGDCLHRTPKEIFEL